MKRQEFWTLIATILGSGIVFLDGTVVNLALPALSRDLGAQFSDLQWVVDAYLLSLTATILISGSLGDMYGRKRIFVIGLVAFGVTSIMCGIAPHISLLIIGRVFQGIAAALLVPSSLAIINTNFPDERRSVAIGRWAAWSGIATVIGPLIGGYFVDEISWRWIFFINVPLIVLCLFLTVRSVKESRDERPRTIDAIGGVLAAAFLALITYGLIEGPAMHWSNAPVGALAIGALCFVLFLWREMHAHDPLVNLKLFLNRNFTGANIATLGMYGALSGFTFALVVFLQTIAGYSSMQAGLALTPATIILLAFSGRMGKLTSAFGARIFMTNGQILTGCGMLLLLHLEPHTRYVTDILPGVLLFGIGLTLLVTPLTVTVMGSVPQSDSGIASGINNAVSRLAGLLVIALLAVFGTAEVYGFAIVLCGVLAIAAGIASLVLVRSR